MGEKKFESGEVEGARRASAGSPDSSRAARRPQRFSARKKGETVVRLLRGEDLELVSRELGVTAARLWRWREAFVAGGQQALRKQGPGTRDEEVSRLKTKVGELTMANELVHLVSLGEDPPRHVIQAGDDLADRTQLPAPLLHGLFSHAPQTKPTGES